MYGGDTKIEETDDLDNNLYLLNTTTLKWTVANPTGPRPSGRYGHSISTIGSKVYIFGGQLDDYFFDDLVCYDLTTLRSPNSQWDLIKPTSASPPPRTNHSVVPFQDKLYLFGGTDGKLWYSDTWCYDPQQNTWSLLECSGFIPAPCEGHSATIVGDIMYVFGGRSSQGKDLSTLSALKLTTRKWFTFQNLGPGPSPRSGHSMTAFGGHKILVMGGESPDVVSTEEESEDKNHTVFVLDTSRINYPPDSSSPTHQQQQQRSPIQQQQRSGSNNSYYQNKPQSPPPQQNLPPKAPSPEDKSSRSPSGAIRSTSPSAAVVSGSGLVPPEGQQSIDEHLRSPSGMSDLTPGVGYERVDVGPNENTNEETDRMSATTYESANERQDSIEEDSAAYSPVYYDENGSKRSLDTQQASSPSLTRKDSSDTMTERNNNSKLQAATEVPKAPDVSNIPGAWQSTEFHEAQDDDTSAPQSANTTRELSSSPNIKREDSLENNNNNDITPTLGHSTFNKKETTLEGDKEVSNVQQALERLKASNSWYETELAAAKDAGYVPSSRPPVDVLKLRRVSQRLTHDTADTLNEREILVTALNELKEELNSVQADVKMQAEAASERISAAEKARDEALQENERLRDGEQPSERLSSSRDMSDNNNVEASEQSVMVSGLESKIKELESKLAESNKTKALLLGSSSVKRGDKEINSRSIEGDDYEENDPEATYYQSIDHLRSDNINLEKQLRTQTDKLVLAEHEVAQMRAQLEELQTRCDDLEGTADDKVQALSTLSLSLQSAEERASEAMRQLSDSQAHRSELEESYYQLQRETEEHKQRYETVQRDLDEHRGLLEHANAQNEHASMALTNHIEKIANMWSSSKSFNSKRRGLQSKPRRQSTRSLSEDGDTTIAAEDEEHEGTRGVEEDEDEEDDDPKYSVMQKRLKEVTDLHETHRAAADKATSELTDALNEISLLKQQLATTDGSRSGTEEQLNKSLEEVKAVKAELEENQFTLNDMTKQHEELKSRFAENEESGGTKYKQLQEEFNQFKEENEKKLVSIDEEHRSRYAELEEDYEKSLQYFKNTETALSRTREELAKYKDMSSKLKDELDDLKLRYQGEDEQDDSVEHGAADRGVSSPSMGGAGSSKYSTKNFDLQLRDLRAQIIILQEERDDLRENILDLKKKGINNKHDLEEAQRQVEELNEENESLRQRVEGTNGSGV